MVVVVGGSDGNLRQYRYFVEMGSPTADTLLFSQLQKQTLKGLR